MWESVSPQTPLALVGCGKMGGAMARGWMKAGLNETHFLIVDPEAAHTGLEGVSCSCVFPSIDELPEEINPSIFVLAVKPQHMADVLPQLVPYMAHDPLILSVAAGTKISTIDEILGKNASIVRAMPNTPAAIGKGITALFANDAVSDIQSRISEGLMKAIGKTLWLESEDQMNGVTALSGSGPAYVFHMVEALASAGVALGLSEEVAVLLARETVVGAGALLDKDHRPVVKLREEVTSPGGTTEAGLHELMGSDENLSTLMRRTLRAAKKRGEEMG